MARRVKASAPTSARRPAAPVVVVKAHPVAWRTARQVARPGTTLLPRPDGSVVVVNART